MVTKDTVRLGRKCKPNYGVLIAQVCMFCDSMMKHSISPVEWLSSRSLTKRQQVFSPQSKILVDPLAIPYSTLLILLSFPFRRLKNNSTYGLIKLKLKWKHNHWIIVPFIRLLDQAQACIILNYVTKARVLTRINTSQLGL